MLRSALALIVSAGLLAGCERHTTTEVTASGEVEKDTKAVSVDENAVKKASAKVAAEVTAAGTAIVAGVKEGAAEGRAEAKADLGTAETAETAETAKKEPTAER